jgi:hypothetical protein
VLILISAGLLGGNLIARYGNERLEYFTRGDVAATRELYRLARPGAVLVAGARNLPWKFKEYDEFKYRIVADSEAWKRAERTNGNMRPVLKEVEAIMKSGGPAGSYLIVTRSQKAYLEGFGFAPRGFALTVPASSRTLAGFPKGLREPRRRYLRSSEEGLPPVIRWPGDGS